MITQDSLKYYIARSASGVTEVKLLSKLNPRTGKAKVLVVKAGALSVPNNTVIEDFQLVHGVLKFVEKDFEVRFSSEQSDKFFDNQEVKDVLLSRGKSKANATCVSGEDIDGVHHRYTSEYVHWNVMTMWAKVAHCLSDEERRQWFTDNPEPANKFREETTNDQPK